MCVCLCVCVCVCVHNSFVLLTVCVCMKMYVPPPPPPIYEDVYILAWKYFMYIINYPFIHPKHQRLVLKWEVSLCEGIWFISTELWRVTFLNIPCTAWVTIQWPWQSAANVAKSTAVGHCSKSCLKSDFSGISQEANLSQSRNLSGLSQPLFITTFGRNNNFSLFSFLFQLGSRIMPQTIQVTGSLQTHLFQSWGDHWVWSASHPDCPASSESWREEHTAQHSWNHWRQSLCNPPHHPNSKTALLWRPLLPGWSFPGRFICPLRWWSMHVSQFFPCITWGAAKLISV